MNRAESVHTGIVQALKSADPEFEIRIHGVFHQHRDVNAAQSIGQFLHGKGIHHRACAYPQQVHAVLQRSLHVCRRSHLGGDEHAQFFFHAGEPRQALFAHAFEAAGLGARFPYTGAKYFDPIFEQLPRRGQHLFLCFGRARAGDHGGTCWVDAEKREGREFEFHIV